MTRQVEPIYLGDGVYAIFDGYVVELRANDPVNPTDRMFLDDNKEEIVPYKFLADAKNSVEKVAERKMELFGSGNRI